MKRISLMWLALLCVPLSLIVPTVVGHHYFYFFHGFLALSLILWGIYDFTQPKEK